MRHLMASQFKICAFSLSLNFFLWPRSSESAMTRYNTFCMVLFCMFLTVLIPSLAVHRYCDLTFWRYQIAYSKFDSK